jgi:threonine dehydrogenase-like Zn-dependent dehydrogenase
MSAATGNTDGVVKLAADADPTTADNHRFSGLAKNESTDTVAAAGVVYTWLPFPGLIYRGKAKSATAANTQAKIDALKGARVIFDLTGTTWTVDTAATDAAANGVIVIGGDYHTNTVHFIISPGVTIMNTQN